MVHPALSTPIALVGLGISNVSVRKLLDHMGVPPSEVHNFDDKGADGAISDPTQLENLGVRTLVVSPGYPLSKVWIARLRDKGVTVTSEIDYAARFLEKEKVVAITGSLGKSTTTSLVGAGLRASGRPYFVGGNLGYPLADYVLACLKKERVRAEVLVLELSSFQLECCDNLPMHVSAITYLCSNHLERYRDLVHYYDTKRVVFDRAIDASFANGASPELHAYLKSHGLLSAPRFHEVNVTDGLVSRDEFDRKALVGEHNNENIALAAAILKHVGLWDENIKEGLLKFPGLAHRMERVDLGPDKPLFINDSKATALESVLTAIHSVLGDPSFKKNPGRKLICLIGGRDKKHPWEKLTDLFPHVSFLEMHFFGECAEEASRRSGLRGKTHPTLRAAMEDLRRSAPKNAAILLSPGGTSLDEFKNFEDRGLKFAAWVRELWGA